MSPIRLGRLEKLEMGERRRTFRGTDRNDSSLAVALGALIGNGKSTETIFYVLDEGGKPSHVAKFNGSYRRPNLVDNILTNPERSAAELVHTIERFKAQAIARRDPEVFKTLKRI